MVWNDYEWLQMVIFTMNDDIPWIALYHVEWLYADNHRVVKKNWAAELLNKRFGSKWNSPWGGPKKKKTTPCSAHPGFQMCDTLGHWHLGCARERSFKCSMFEVLSQWPEGLRKMMYVWCSFPQNINPGVTNPQVCWFWGLHCLLSDYQSFDHEELNQIIDMKPKVALVGGFNSSEKF